MMFWSWSTSDTEKLARGVPEGEFSDTLSEACAPCVADEGSAEVVTGEFLRVRRMRMGRGLLSLAEPGAAHSPTVRDRAGMVFRACLL